MFVYFTLKAMDLIKLLLVYYLSLPLLHTATISLINNNSLLTVRGEDFKAAEGNSGKYLPRRN